MPPTVAELEQTFKTYFEELDRCESTKCYWALLHVVVALPDVCAALESTAGDAGNGGPYRAWCKEHFTGRYLTPDDRYAIRCALLHQGRTTPDRGTWLSYSFVQPSPSGQRVHNWVTPSERNITLDVGEMASETKHAMRNWFLKLQLPINATRAANVQKHLPHLAHEKPKTGVPGINQTFSSTST